MTLHMMDQGKPEAIRARLDKAGDWTLCGRIHCGNRLAGIRANEVRNESTGAPLGHDRQVWFEPGWVSHLDGTWRFAEYAKKRFAKGRKPKVRRYRYREGVDLHRHDALWGPADLPTQAVCWKCGATNSIVESVVTPE